MKHLLTILSFFLMMNTLYSQTIYKEIDSYKLNDKRKIKIQLPRTYEENIDKAYPIILVLDGDYLFEPVAGNVDYYSYWDDMPEAIVVGINQSETREDDTFYSEDNFLPEKTGARFFEFIGQELLPYIDANYRTLNLRIAIGHGETASFLNYYLLKDKPIFSAFVVLSPALAPQMIPNIAARLQQFKMPLFYYLAIGSNDIKFIREDTQQLNSAIAAINNDKLFYKYNLVEEASHYSAPAQVIPKALDFIFSVYKPISKTEYKERILPLKTSPVDYLIEKYETIKNVIGIEKSILPNDFKAIEAYIKKHKAFHYYEDLGKLAKKEYPDTVLGYYYLGRFHEENGDPKKALKTYKSAYILDNIAGITQDDLIERGKRIKDEFGY